MTARRVVLWHGLGRWALSLAIMEKVLRRRTMCVRSLDHASTRATIADHAAALAPKILQFASDDPVSFVTHSMGGIVLRWLAHPKQGNAAVRRRIERAAMLATPNGGSQIVDQPGAFVPMDWVNGTADVELGTRGTPSTLGPVRFPVGIIASRRSLNPVTSAMPPGNADGKVSASATCVEGERSRAPDHAPERLTPTCGSKAPGR